MWSSVHRESDDEDWQTLGIDRTNFGDKYAATGLEVAKEMTTDKGMNICSKTMKQLKSAQCPECQESQYLSLFSQENFSQSCPGVLDCYAHKDLARGLITCQ